MKNLKEILSEVKRAKDSMKGDKYNTMADAISAAMEYADNKGYKYNTNDLASKSLLGKGESREYSLGKMKAIITKNGHTDFTLVIKD